ncbi:uncharacterized protein ASPGLDRAFT_52102 [Aspergillus glaucus CBS 516.65]|uniref:Uncharacterized protein n=1 Tax=Aspergillus glaucus CBS 516.65 TaxID=1160497 RepID=A0A1L9V7Q0_ASPGL|nr:hypothetical protein ASPGLDRAFT_52102 [Aspergillus glaucus CBS 516.65]OJJ79872.1 hypothetical protein ASPGLDRAFT_52102 [Aspergillus glaucus CBS 516.65]
MSDFWEAFFDSLPPSPEWAPFWGSLFEGALSASLIWLTALIISTKPSAFELICHSLVHVCLFVFAVLFGFQDGWPMLAVTELFGRTIVVLSFLVAIYTVYDKQGRSWNRARTDRLEDLSQKDRKETL